MSPPPAASTSQAASSGNNLVALHRSRLVHWSPPAVVALAARGDGGALAAAYEDGAVELWDPLNWTSRTVAAGGTASELRALCWVQDAPAGSSSGPSWRLFTGSLDGMVREITASHLVASHPADACGGAIWALAACPVPPTGTAPAQIAAACDDGSVRLMHVEAGMEGAQYARMLAKAEERLLAVTWHPNGHMVAGAGAGGTIHCWHSGTGHELLRITAGFQTRGEPLCVWALKVLRDGTLVSGDSSGAVQFWDSTHGTLLQRFTVHRADVLCLAAAADDHAVFASGLDSSVAIFTRSHDRATSTSKWAYLHYKRPHSHDVHCLAVVSPPGEDDVLVSGGTDAQLIAYSAPQFLKQHPVRVSRTPRPPLVSLAASPAPPPTPAGANPSHPPPATRMISCTGKTVDLWQLATSATDSTHPPTPARTHKAHAANAEGQPIDLASQPLHLARIETTCTSNIVAAALAPNGALLAVSDASSLRLFTISGGDGLPCRIAKRSLGARRPAEPVVALAFSPDSGVLYAASPDGTVTAVPVGDGVAAVAADDEDGSEAAVVQRWQHKVGKGGAAAAVGAGGGSGSGSSSGGWQPLPVAVLAVAPAGGLVAAAGALGVQLLQHAAAAGGLKWERQLLPPQRAGVAVTAAAFNATGQELAVALSDRSVKILSVQRGGQTPWSVEAGPALARCLAGLPGPSVGLSYNPAVAESLVVFAAGGLCHVDTSRPATPEQYAQGKQRRAREQQRKNLDGSAERGRNLRVICLEHPCLHLAFAGPSSMLLLERPWEHVVAALPPPLYRPRYGA